MVLSRYLFGRVRKPMKTCHESRYIGRESNWALPAYDSEAQRLRGTDGRKQTNRATWFKRHA
jgi:hypothetical protein